MSSRRVSSSVANISSTATTATRANTFADTRSPQSTIQMPSSEDYPTHVFASLPTTRAPTPPAPAIRAHRTTTHVRDNSALPQHVRLTGGAAAARTIDHGIVRDLPTSQYCIELNCYELVWPAFRFTLPYSTSIDDVDERNHQHRHQSHRATSTRLTSSMLHHSVPFNETYGTNVVYITSPRRDSVDAFILIAISKSITRQYALDVDVVLRYWLKVQRNSELDGMSRSNNNNNNTNSSRSFVSEQDVETVPRAWKMQRCLRSNQALFSVVNDKKLFKGKWAAIFKMPDDCVEAIKNLPGRALGVVVQIQRRVIEYNGHKKIPQFADGRDIKPNGPFADLRLRVLYPFGIKKPMTPIEARIDTSVMAMRSESFRQKIEAKLINKGELERLTLSKLEFSVHPSALAIRPSSTALSINGNKSSALDVCFDGRQCAPLKRIGSETVANDVMRLFCGRKKARLDTTCSSSDNNNNNNKSATCVRTVTEAANVDDDDEVVVMSAANSADSTRKIQVASNSNINRSRGEMSVRRTVSEDDDCTQQITFNYMSPAALREFTRYIYEGLIDPVNYDFLTTAQLYAASDKMHFDELKKPLLDRMCFLMEAGAPGDLFDAFSLAYELKVPTVQRHAEILVEKYAKTVLHGREWDEFKTDYPDLIAELVRALA